MVHGEIVCSHHLLAEVAEALVGFEFSTRVTCGAFSRDHVQFLCAAEFCHRHRDHRNFL